MPFVTIKKGSYHCFYLMIYDYDKYTSQLKDLDNRFLLKFTNIEPEFAKRYNPITLFALFKKYFCHLYIQLIFQFWKLNVILQTFRTVKR
jgi:hypothetical protein